MKRNVYCLVALFFSACFTQQIDHLEKGVSRNEETGVWLIESTLSGTSEQPVGTLGVAFRAEEEREIFLELFLDGVSFRQVTLRYQGSGEHRFDNLDLSSFAGTTDSLAVEIQITNGRTESTVKSYIPFDQGNLSLLTLKRHSQVPVQVWFLQGVPTATLMKIPTHGTDLLEQSLNFLHEYKEFYRIEDPLTNLIPIRIDKENSTQTIVFQQMHDGLAVMGSYLSLHIENGFIRGSNANYLSKVPDAEEAVVSSNDAVRNALRHTNINDFFLPGEPALVFLNEGLYNGELTLTKLAWRIHIQETIRESRLLEVLVDAHTGRVLMVMKDSRDATPEKNFDILNQHGFQESFLTACFIGDSDTSTECDGSETCDTSDMDSFHVHQLAHQNYDYYHDTYHWHSLDGKSASQNWDGYEVEIETVVRVPGTTNGAVWRAGCNQIRFAPGAVSARTYGHEISHAITEYTSDIDSGGQCGSVEEHIANLLGTHFVRHGYDPTTLPTFFGFPLPTQDPTSWFNFGEGIPNHMNQFDTSEAAKEDSHINRPILDKAGRLLWDGGTHSGIDVVGIGQDKISQLYFRVLTKDIESATNFTVFRTALVARAQAFSNAEKEAYGTGHFFTDDDVCSVQNAFASVGIGAADQDCDGTGDDIDDFVDYDIDNDSVGQGWDNCPEVFNPTQSDMDKDGQGDVCDDDIDGDGFLNDDEVCPTVYNPGNGQTQDFDDNDIPDACDDMDNDDVFDAVDNCKLTYNPFQADFNDDGFGDACQDLDGDSFWDELDNCPMISNFDQEDIDSDGVGDVCDNCEAIANTDQGDCDNDGIGNACEDDDDNDGIVDSQDNCPCKYNPSQLDSNFNGIGYKCDPSETAAFTQLPHGQFSGFYTDRPEPIRIPFPSCGTFPDWLDTDFAVTLDLTNDIPMGLFISDSEGRMLKRSKGENAVRIAREEFKNTISFTPKPDTFYRAGQREAVSMREHTLWILPGRDAVPGERFTFEMSCAYERP